MHNIAIIADTHDNSPAVVWIIEYLNQHQISTTLHAGDLIAPDIVQRFADHYQGELHFVFGNNDGERALLERRATEATNITCHLTEMRQELFGKQVFMHHYSSVAESIAKSGEFDLAVGGHDHQYRVNQYGGCLFVNPGNTVTKDKWQTYDPDKESSFVVLDLVTMEHQRIMLPKELQG